MLVYSQFLLMLDVLEWYCAARGFPYLRLDGSIGEWPAARRPQGEKRRREASRVEIAGRSRQG